MARNVVEKSRENITKLIEEKLLNMPPIAEECSIYRVPKRLLDMNCNAYKPKVISIGPFHHDQQNFRDTEELKFRFFKSYQCRVVNMINIEDIVEVVQSWETTARQYYSGVPLNMDSEEFVKMMILDGCFIVELMIMNIVDLFPKNQNTVRYSCYKAISLNIHQDIIMLENQLPFFVLQGLFDLVSPESFVLQGLFDLVSPTSYDSNKLFQRIVHRFLNLCVLRIESGAFSDNMMNNEQPRHLVDFLSFYFVNPLNKTIKFVGRWYLPPSATELSEAGVVFKKVEEKETCIMDISFKNGILNIPPLEIDDSFETWARNLLAFTQFSCKENAIHYFLFLDELITTEKDVNLLVKEGIIINKIGGSDKEISQLFNDICKNIAITSISCFCDVANDLKQHCGRRRNKWMASLRRKYFYNPWTLISFLAATFLILLTLLQTIFTVISTFK